MRTVSRLRRPPTYVCVVIASFLTLEGMAMVRGPVSALAAPACPVDMTYDYSMDLCVPRGWSFDTSFMPPPTGCGMNGTPSICRGPLPRPPVPPQPLGPAQHNSPGYRQPPQ